MLTTNFQPDHFIATVNESPTRNTRAGKAWFANKFVNFVQNGCRFQDFPEALYARLSMCFGFTGMHNRETFYKYHFSTSDARYLFVKQVLAYVPTACPTYTYSDAERILQVWLRAYRQSVAKLAA